MTRYEAAAHIDSRGDISGDRAGDQTGHEVSVEVYSNCSWDGVLRYSGARTKRVRNRLMKCAYRLARYNKVGYDQGQRSTLYDIMAGYKWLLRHVTKVKACETDCSAFVGVCVNVAMVPLHLASAIPRDIWTGNERAYLQARGFRWITSGIDFSSGAGLKLGDVLLAHNSRRQHTAIYMGTTSSGQLYGSNTSAAEPSKSVDEVAHDVMCGRYGDGEERRRALSAAGYDPDVVQARVNQLWSLYS